jgi:hypothetical protein
MKLEVFTAVKIHLVVFLDMTWCSLVDEYQCFGGLYCLRLQGSSVITKEATR